MSRLHPDEIFTTPNFLVGFGAIVLFLEAVHLQPFTWLSPDALAVCAVICIVGGLGMTGRTEE